MKRRLIVLFCTCSLPAIAGSTGQPATPAPAAIPQPDPWSWFIGDSAGYLVETEEFMYCAAVGVDTPWNGGGWQVALYGEVGFTEVEDNFSGILTGSVGGPRPFTADIETEIIPITFNVKLERPLSGGFSAYCGAGAGVALVDLTSSSAVKAVNFSDKDTVFAGQLFAGLSYHCDERFEIYGGARWIYLDEATLKGADLDLDDDVLFELGARIHF
jgi:opacity protein-like surface antigen